MHHRDGVAGGGVRDCAHLCTEIHADILALDFQSRVYSPAVGFDGFREDHVGVRIEGYKEQTEERDSFHSGV